jgi:putative glutamine amidotransferase
MSFPMIGITTRTASVSPSSLFSVMVQKSYTDAIIAAGGLPVLIPSDIYENAWNVLVNRLDGILFTGGGDIAIEYFAGEPHSAVYGIDSMRDAIEIGIAKKAAEFGMPFLGICRGLQIVNVALGGSLFTHIPDQLQNAVEHDYPGEDGIPARTALAHSVIMESNSSLSKIMGETRLLVNSLHHQGIKDVAPGLIAAGHAPDGLVEAVELPQHPFGFAVQWHPEWLTDQAPTRNLFEAFVVAASEYRGNGNAK